MVPTDAYFAPSFLLGLQFKDASNEVELFKLYYSKYPIVSALNNMQRT